MKPSLIVAVLMGILLGACSVVSTASDNPFVLVEAEAITSPDTAMVIGAAHPGTGEQVGEIRWEVLEYRIALRNESDETLTGLETGLIPSEAIRELYDGNDPFAESSGRRGHYGKWPEAFDVTPGEEVEIKRGIITYAHETDVARNVGSPLTRGEAGRLLAIADQVTLEVQWDGGSQRFDLAERGMTISKEAGTPSPIPEESTPRASTVTNGSLAYQAETRVQESAEPPALDVSVTVTNVSDQPVHLEYGACDLSLRVYDSPDRSGEPLAQGGHSGGCLLYLMVRDLEPGESLSPEEFQLAVPVRDVLGDALPEGQYYFTAVLEVNDPPVEVPAGDAHLSHRQGQPSPDEVEITCDPRPMPSQEEIDEELAEIKEPIARESYLRRLNRGTGEIVPGFGGVFVDRDDNDIAYIYLLNPENEELVDQAAEILRNRPGGRDFREVRAIQGQYSYSQLLEWINCWDAREPQLSRTTSSGISEGDNSISMGVASEADIALAERELEALGIPREAANIRAIGGIRFK